MSSKVVSKIEGYERPVAWAMFWISIVGFFVTFPLWFFGILSDRQMLGITLVLSWAALWYESFLNAIQMSLKKGKSQ